MFSRLKKDNRGVSLMEIMVVVAILAVVTGVGVMSYNTMSGKPAQQCAQQLTYSLERHRTSTMGKVRAKYVLYKDDVSGKIIAAEYFSNDPDPDKWNSPTLIEVGSKGVDITYISGGTMYTLGTGVNNGLILEFYRETGAFKPQPDGTYCTKISAKRAGRVHDVTLVPLTGKVYID